MSPPVQAAVVGGVATVLAALIGLIAEQIRQGRKLGQVTTHVVNQHKTNLREDLDKVIVGLSLVLDGQRRHSKEIAGLREELRHERIERMDVARRVDRLNEAVRDH